MTENTYEVVGEYQIQLSGWYSIKELEEIIEASKEVRKRHLDSMKLSLETGADNG